MHRLSMPSPSMGVALLALFVALGGTGYAVISASTVPDSSGVFHGCVHKKNGAVRLVEKGKACRKKSKRSPGEFAVQWSQRGPQGVPGAAGTNGANGTSGTNGRDGTTIILRPRSTAEVTTAISAQPVPMSPASWTQGADESDQLLGEVSYDPPPMSDCSQMVVGTPFPGNMTITVKLDGVVIGAGTAFSGPDNATMPLALNSQFEPGTSTPRSLTVEASDNCGVGGGASTTHFVVKAVKINVVSLR